MAGTLYSEIGPTVLKWTTFVDPAELDPGVVDPDPLLVTPHLDQAGAEDGQFNYYVGNPAVDHEVVGSPTGNNLFRVEYLNDGDWELVGETDLFAVTGKIFDPATFEFSIIANAPVAIDDTANLDLNVAGASSVTMDVLANDTFDPPANVTVLPAGEAFGPTDGVAVANGDGTVTYTPNPAFALDGGVDTFGYNILDNSGLTSNTAVVTVTVVPVDTLTVDRARLDTRRLRLEIRGTTSSAGPVTIHAGTSTAGTVLGTATPRNNGTWSFRGTATTNLANITAATPNNTIATSAVQAR
jgi:hypothetical protein